MFRRMSGPMGYSGERLGLWEFQAAGEATELLRQAKANSENQTVNPEDHRRVNMNAARQALWGRR